MATSLQLAASELSIHFLNPLSYYNLKGCTCSYVIFVTMSDGEVRNSYNIFYLFAFVV